MPSFGDLLTHYRSRKHGLSQNRLAELSGVAAPILSNMCHGDRLTGTYARERVLRIVFALFKEGVVREGQEANALLDAAKMSALEAGELLAIFRAIQKERADITLADGEFAQLKTLHQPRASLEISTPVRSFLTLPDGRLRGRYIPAPEYTRLFGADAVVKHLALQLSAPAGPRFLSLEGMGGIGKTALARAVAQAYLMQSTHNDVLWVSVRQTRFITTGDIVREDAAHSLEDVVNALAMQLGLPAISDLSVAQKLVQIELALQATPHLIVIDNLETFSDTGLLPTLHPLASVARFLLTSRHTLSHYSYVHIVKVSELSPLDSQALLQSEMSRLGRDVSLSLADMEHLSQVVGGLPLALKLAAAQIGRIDLNIILNGLRRAQQQSVEQLYTFIYWHSWSCLSHTARQLLLALLTMSPTGEDAEFIQSQSGLSESDFTQALNQLLDYNLVEVSAMQNKLYYFLHRLTSTFLQTTLLHRWVDGLGK